MSDGETARRQYAGRGVGKLPTNRAGAAVQLPGARTATMLPDPLGHYGELRAQFVAANGRVPGTKPERNDPLLTIQDVNAIGNHVSAALRNDLTAIDSRDAAVIWEQWRRAVADLKELIRHGSTGGQLLVVGGVLDQRAWNAHNSLATALLHPGEVFENYCPWRSDWATPARLHPEAM